MKNTFAVFGTVWIAALSLSVASLSAQTPQRVQSIPPQRSAPPSFPADGTHAYGGYMVGVGDLLNIRVAEEDDMTGRYQVTPNGEVELPLLKQPIHAAGLSTFALSKSIREQLQKQEILKEPSVTVFIERGMSQNITMLGQVSRPGTYPIERPTTLIDAISMAGGLTPTAGQFAAVNQHSQQAVQNLNTNGTDQPTVDSLQQTERVISVDLKEVMSGTRPTSNLLVSAGDVITISDAATIYVVGAVVKPGAFTVQDQTSGMTVLRAIAMVEGTQPTASLGKTIIVRHSTKTTEREEIPVDLANVMKGKIPDPILESNDILFIPQSGFKKGMRRAADVAVIAAGEIIGYGVGLRIAK